MVIAAQRRHHRRHTHPRTQLHTCAARRHDELKVDVDGHVAGRDAVRVGPAHTHASAPTDDALDVLAHRSAVSVRDLGHSGHRHTQVAQRDAHQRRGEDVLQRRAALGVQREHGVAQLRDVVAGLGVDVQNGAELPRHDVVHDLGDVLPFERALQREQLVQHDAHREEVRLLPVGLVRADLRREVVRRAAEGAAGGARDGHVVLPREAEVAQLQHPCGRDEDVLRFDVAVHHALVVDVVHGEAQLCEHDEGLVALEEGAVAGTGVHLETEVPSGGKLHQQQDRALVLVVGDVADDVGVVAVREALDLVHGEAALVLAHELHVEHLGDVLLVALRHDPHLLAGAGRELLYGSVAIIQTHHT
eukprot:PhM_4_TR10024/c4_g1_i12/m.94885